MDELELAENLRRNLFLTLEKHADFGPLLADLPQSDRFRMCELIDDSLAATLRHYQVHVLLAEAGE